MCTLGLLATQSGRRVSRTGTLHSIDDTERSLPSRRGMTCAVPSSIICRVFRVTHLRTLPLGQYPGALLRLYVLPALKLSVSQAARDLAITRQTLHRILAGAAALTPEMAVRLERLCGVASEFWLDRQHRHELQRVRRENGDVLARIPSRALPKGILKQIGASDRR